jgi:peptide/nickel transport system substrate-binding protein
VTVRWKRPYIDADTMFANGGSGTAYGLPLPKHLLEETYTQDKANFLSHPYWSQEFVGTGPFRLKEFVSGSHVVLQANDRYTLGRPKIDEVEVRFILDLNVIVTNLMAGAIDMTMGRGFSIENVLQVREQWRGGTAEVSPRAWIVIHPQFIDPSPAVISDVRFRRAMMHATDRQGMMDSLQGGLTAVSHVFLSPTEPEYREVEDAAVRYDYDPRRAAQMIEDLGYRKGPDGIYRDASNQRLALDMRTYGIKVSDAATVSIADEWTRFGVATEPLIIPPQRISDREYMATFPSFLMYRQPNSASDLARLRGPLAPTAETRFIGSNYARYVNPEFDAIIDRYITTIPRAERIQILRQAIRHISENLNLMGLFYDAEIGFFNSRLQNVKARENRLWDIPAWDVK